MAFSFDCIDCYLYGGMSISVNVDGNTKDSSIFDAQNFKKKSFVSSNRSDIDKEQKELVENFTRNGINLHYFREFNPDFDYFLSIIGSNISHIVTCKFVSSTQLIFTLPQHDFAEVVSSRIVSVPRTDKNLSRISVSRFHINLEYKRDNILECFHNLTENLLFPRHVYSFIETRINSDQRLLEKSDALINFENIFDFYLRCFLSKSGNHKRVKNTMIQEEKQIFDIECEELYIFLKKKGLQKLLRIFKMVYESEFEHKLFCIDDDEPLIFFAKTDLHPSRRVILAREYKSIAYSISFLKSDLPMNVRQQIILLRNIFPFNFSSYTQFDITYVSFKERKILTSSENHSLSNLLNIKTQSYYSVAKETCAQSCLKSKCRSSKKISYQILTPIASLKPSKSFTSKIIKKDKSFFRSMKPVGVNKQNLHRKSALINNGDNYSSKADSSTASNFLPIGLLETTNDQCTNACEKIVVTGDYNNEYAEQGSLSERTSKLKKVDSNVLHTKDMKNLLKVKAKNSKSSLHNQSAYDAQLPNINYLKKFNTTTDIEYDAPLSISRVIDDVIAKKEREDRATEPLPLQLSQDSWSTVASSKFLKKLSSKEIRRQEIIYELIYTENKYVKTTRAIYLLSQKCLLETMKFPPDTIDKIIPNVQSIITLNGVFLASLFSKQNTENWFVQSVGEVLLSQFTEPIVEHMIEAYSQIVLRKDLAIEEYKRLTKTSKKFGNFVNALANRAYLRRLTIPEIVTFMAQRFTKYPILIAELLKHTREDHADYKNIKFAHYAAKCFVETVNVKVSDDANHIKLQQIMERLDVKNDCVGIYPVTKLFPPETKAIKIQNVVYRTKQRSYDITLVAMWTHLLLLNDKDQKINLLSAEQPTVLPLQNLFLRTVATDQNAFFLVDKVLALMYEIVCPSPLEKSNWINQINKHLKENAKDFNYTTKLS